MRKIIYFGIFVMILFAFGASAQSFVNGGETVGTTDVTVCCEKTNSGLTCLDVKKEDCMADSRQPPTACESTSFCKPGWCYDSTEGTCLDNVPQAVCNREDATWSAEKPAACNLGCCILDDQASFVSLVRCKKLSGFYGLETNWDSEITNEALCVLQAGTQEKGACVYEEEFQKTCKFTTKGACTADNVFDRVTGGTGTNRNPGLDTSSFTPAANEADEETGSNGDAFGGTVGDDSTPENGGTVGTAAAILPFATAQDANDVTSQQNQNNGVSDPSGVEFFPGKLCTAEELGTNCAPTRNTICAPGKEEVYFADTCGNPANIYDASKVTDVSYWTNIIEKENSCGAGGNNQDSQSCGNCNYLLGSYCRPTDEDTAKPTYGDFICKDLNCKDEEGKQRIHGESWCVYDGGSTGAPGSRYYRQLCRNGEIKVEACADFRQEECIESVQGGFSQAACRVNRWQDCTAQTEQENCENGDKRDCRWMNGFEYVLFGSIMNGTTPDANSLGAIGKAVNDAGGIENIPRGACVPKIPPGFDFDSDEGATVCAQANAVCPVTYEKGLVGGDWECVEHCECLPGGELEKKRVELCTSLGDCGPKTNFVGVKGSGKGYEVKEQEQKDEE